MKALRFGLAAAALVGGTWACRSQPTLASRARELGLTLPAELALPLVEATQPTSSLTIVRAGNQTQTARLSVWRVADAAAVTRELAAQQALLSSLFEARLPPYPEFLTQESGCAKEYKPKERAHPLGSVFLLYAGERLGFGVCTADLVHFKAAVAFLKCPAQPRAYRMEIFLPASTAWDELARLAGAISCAQP